jgi:hypothetical protein
MTKYLQNREFDNVLKNKLSNISIEPRASVWNSIESALQQKPIKPNTTYTASKVSVLAVVLSITSLMAIFIVLLRTDIQQHEKGERQKHSSFFSEKQTNLHHALTSDESSAVTGFSHKTDKPKQTTQPTNTASTTLDDEKDVFADPSYPKKDIVLQEAENHSVQTSLPEKNTDECIAPATLNPLVVRKIASEPMKKIFQLYSWNSQNNKQSHSVSNLTQISLNLGFQSINNTHNAPMFQSFSSLNNGIHFGVHYEYDDLFFETGVVFSQIKRQNSYNHSITAEFPVGHYELIDSVEFIQTWDEQTSSWITTPHYHTSIVSIYEQQTHVNSISKEDTYHYLQVPLYFGIKKPAKRFSYEFKAGFLFNSLISSSEIKNHHNHWQQNQLQNEYTLLTTPHYQYFFSVVLAAGVSYKVHDVIEFYATPLYQQQIKTIFQSRQPISKPPFAFGVQSGLRVKL